MRRVAGIIVVLLLIAAGAGGGWWYVRAHPEALDRLVAELGLEAQPVEGITGSGFIEAEEVSISSEVGGRIEAITVDEGDEAQEGQVLIRLDTAILKAQIRQAEAALEVLRVRLDKMTLRSPLAGLVTSRAINVGETAAPGGTLLTVANLDEVKLTIYVPETQIGRVTVGQEVEVQVDSYPHQVFQGRVVPISPRAEFTPKNVQTPEERVSIVFAVRVALPNAGHELKPGMPADARILTE